MYGRGILAVSYTRTVPIADEAKVVLSVMGASHQSANNFILAVPCLTRRRRSRNDSDPSRCRIGRPYGRCGCRYSTEIPCRYT
jgi:hypothetical protein